MHMDNQTLIEAVYERTSEDDSLPADLRLTITQWATLFSCDGYRCLLEIALDLRSTPGQVYEALNHLESLGLVRERQLDLAEYSRIAALAAQAESQSSPLSLSQLTARRDALAEARRKLGVKSVAKNNPTPAPSIPFQPLEISNPQQHKNPAAMPNNTQRTLNLGGLVRFIASRDKDSASGQLAVYRVFMGVNTALLRDAGIHSLRFDDTVSISNPGLIDAITRSVEKNLGIPIPEHLFSAAGSSSSG